MTRNNCLSKWIIGTITLIFIAISGWWLLNSQDQQLSVKPAISYSNFQLEPVQSNIGLHTKLPFSSLVNAAEQATTQPQTGSGEKQSCKRILGAQVCATLKWQYSIQRDGDIQVTSQDQQLQLQLPVSFNGTVSVDGRGGKLLGLRNKAIDGKLALIADLDFSIGSDWCPVLNSDVRYRWISDPKITLAGSIRLNLRKTADKALTRQLKKLQSQLTSLIDCNRIRQSVQQQWHTHTIDVDLKDGISSLLTVTPLNASVSDVTIKPDHVSLAFDLAATVQMQQPEPGVENPPTQTGSTSLPDLSPHTSTPGAVEFNLLLEVPYDLLRKKLAGKTVGNTYGPNNSNSLTVTSIDLYPAGTRLIIDVGFKAYAFGSLIETTGNVYISARPVADPVNNQLLLEDLHLTRIIDSRLMSAVATVLRTQLLSALQEVSVVDLDASMAAIESSIATSLSNPEKTAGLQIDVQSPQVRLIALNPQANGLAAVLHLSTQLEATVPDSVLIR